METKICKTCNKEKEISKFEKGYTECMACRKAAYRKNKTAGRWTRP